MFFDDLGKYAGRVAIIDNEEKITYSELQEHLEELDRVHAGVDPEEGLAGGPRLVQ